jgi:hypothetical protein
MAALAFTAPVLPGITHDDLTRFAHEATGQRRDTNIASRQPFGGSGITTELAWLQPTPCTGYFDHLFKKRTWPAG